MSGSVSPKTHCDAECALMNHCVQGGEQCAGCDEWFCADDLNDECLCPRCAKERVEEEE